jgi:hypothetical protein
MRRMEAGRFYVSRTLDFSSINHSFVYGQNSLAVLDCTNLSLYHLHPLPFACCKVELIIVSSSLDPM